MLITLLSFFDRCRYKRSDNNDYYSSSTSPTSSIVHDVMSADGDYDDNDDHDDHNRAREDGEWQHITIPISEEEDYEVVFSPSDFCQQQQGEHQQRQQEETIVDTSNNISNNIMDRVQEWNRQRNLQRNQLGASISKTFTELSREEPDQMEEDAIKRAMELSMLDVALVYHRHDDRSQQRQQQHPQIVPHKILDVSENAHPTEIKTAYRKLARLHVSITMCYSNLVLRCI